MKDHSQRQRSDDAVRERYDRLASASASPFTEHVHHGYWDGAGDPLAAQVRLIEKLVHFASIPRGARVLDIGCGTGGAARWLAENLGCSVLGISISPVEVAAAIEKARGSGVENLIEFHVADANKMDFPEASFDAVWIVETSEHLVDKRRFLENCARVLKPGGRLALATCLAPAHPMPRQIERLAEVGRVLLTEPLNPLPDYIEWTRVSGFSQIMTKEITDQVAPTWSHLLERTSNEHDDSLGEKLARRQVIKLLTTMKAAYADGAIGYGLLSAVKDKV